MYTHKQSPGIHLLSSYTLYAPTHGCTSPSGSAGMCILDSPRFVQVIYFPRERCGHTGRLPESNPIRGAGASSAAPMCCTVIPLWQQQSPPLPLQNTPLDSPFLGPCQFPSLVFWLQFEPHFGQHPCSAEVVCVCVCVCVCLRVRVCVWMARIIVHGGCRASPTWVLNGGYINAGNDEHSPLNIATRTTAACNERLCGDDVLHRGWAGRLMSNDGFDQPGHALLLRQAPTQKDPREKPCQGPFVLSL